jgi:transposase-like protein
MDNEASSPGTIKRRRRYSQEFKQRILAEARQPGASLAAVAVRHGLNPNMVHKWRQALQRSGQSEFLRLPAPANNAPATGSTPTSTAAPCDAKHLDTIHMEVPTPQGQLVVHWPVSHLPESIAWLRALTR